METLLFPSEMQLSPEALAHISAEARGAMWRSASYTDFFGFFNDLVKSFHREPAPAGAVLRVGRAAELAHRLSGPYLSMMYRNSRRCKADVMIIGEAGRSFLVPMMRRIVRGVLRQERTVLYLVARGSYEHREICKEVVELGREGQLTFADPWAMRNTMDNGMRTGESRHRAAAIYRRILGDLPLSLHLWPTSLEEMSYAAKAHLAWELLQDHVDYDTLIVRNHFFPPLSAVAAMSSVQRGKHVVTLQHGAIADLHSHFPVVAHRTVCFGESSCQVMRKYDRRFNADAGRTAICQDFIPGGSLFDTIQLLPSTFEKKSVMILDQSAIQTEAFYGVQREFNALIDSVRQLLRNSRTVERVIVRLHPTNRTGRNWLPIKEEFPDKVEISHPAYSYQFDISRSSLVLGLFSTGLPTAAACGIPTLLLWEPGGFYTPDMAGFIPDGYVAPDQLVNRIDALLSNERCYNDAREFALSAGGAYYHQRGECDFEPALIERMLTPLIA